MTATTVPVRHRAGLAAGLLQPTGAILRYGRRRLVVLVVMLAPADVAPPFWSRPGRASLFDAVAGADLSPSACASCAPTCCASPLAGRAGGLRLSWSRHRAGQRAGVLPRPGPGLRPDAGARHNGASCCATPWSAPSSPPRCAASACSGQWRGRVGPNQEPRLRGAAGAHPTPLPLQQHDTIASLIRTRPAATRRAVGDRSRSFRAACALARVGRCTLGEDSISPWAICASSSCALERRLRVAWDVADLPRSAELPALLLQPLVNAVYHGVQPAGAGGTVAVRGWRADGHLHRVETLSAGSWRRSGGHGNPGQHPGAHRVPFRRTRPPGRGGRRRTSPAPCTCPRPRRTRPGRTAAQGRGETTARRPERMSADRRRRTPGARERLARAAEQAGAGSSAARRQRRRAARDRAPCAPTWSCSTSACPAWTAWTWRAPCSTPSTCQRWCSAPPDKLRRAGLRAQRGRLPAPKPCVERLRRRAARSRPRRRTPGQD